MPDKPPTDGKTARIRDVAGHVAEAVHDRIGGAVNDRKLDHLTNVLETFERDLAPHVGALLSGTMDRDALPEHVRGLLDEITHPKNLTSSLLVGIAIGAIIYPVLGSMTAPTAQDIANEVWSHNPVNPLSPAEIAVASLRHNPYVTDPTGEAAKSGLNGERLNALIYNTGESLAIGELLLLYRRGQITEDRLVTGLRQSRIRDEWLPELLDLRFAPPGAGEVIAGSLKGHLVEADARQKLGEAGINPDNFDWLRATAGRPPGIQQVIELWNRGYATEADVDEVVRQSDINDRFLPLVKDLRWYHVPPRSIVPMLRAGGITEARARQLLTEHGVRAEDQDAFIAEAHTTRTTTERSITATQTVAAYEERLITRAEAAARIVAMRYPAADAELLLEIADTRATDRAAASAVGRVHTHYVTWRSNKTEATADLQALLVPAIDVTALFGVWDHERAANAPVLSNAQLQGALYRDVITLDQFISSVKTRGYAGLQVKILAAEAYPHGKVPPNVIALNPATL